MSVLIETMEGLKEVSSDMEVTEIGKAWRLKTEELVSAL